MNRFPVQYDWCLYLRSTICIDEHGTFRRLDIVPTDISLMDLHAFYEALAIVKQEFLGSNKNYCFP